jgi:hypothetical protein
LWGGPEEQVAEIEVENLGAKEWKDEVGKKMYVYLFFGMILLCYLQVKQMAKYLKLNRPLSPFSAGLSRAIALRTFAPCRNTTSIADSQNSYF